MFCLFDFIQVCDLVALVDTLAWRFGEDFRVVGLSFVIMLISRKLGN